MKADTIALPDAPQPARASVDLPLPLLLGYGVGQVGGQIFRDTPALLLPIFLSTMLGVPAWMAGLSILVPKIWVTFCDPLVGAWSDRKKASWGRRPFLLVGAIVSGLTFFALFVPPTFTSPFATAAYATLVFAIASTGFSLFSVPYLTIASEMTDDTHLRTKIIAYRLAFTAVGLIIGAGAAQPMVLWFGGGRGGYAAMGAVLGGICLVTMAAAYFGTSLMRATTSQREAPGVLAQFKTAWRNRAFRLLAGAYFLQMVGSACGYTVLGLFFIYVVRDVPMILLFILVLSITAALAQPLWLFVSRSFGKKPTYILCICSWCALTLTWMFVHPATDIVMVLPVLGPLSSQGSLIVVRAILIGIVNSGFILMAFSLLTDTIADDRLKSGLSREGSFSGVFSALEKLAFAAGPAITGAFLSLMGFVSSHGGAGAQSSQAILGVVLSLSLLPVVLTAASLVPLFRFRI
jgi:GPH family glycoside/pentoside/hexuronide:cation symporter